MSKAYRYAFVIQDGKNTTYPQAPSFYPVKYLQYSPFAGAFVWTNDVDRALQLARRVDAEMIAEECEEANYIIEKAFEVMVTELPFWKKAGYWATAFFLLAGWKAFEMMLEVIAQRVAL